VALRTVPEVIFRYDRSTDNAMRIEELLSGLPELQDQRSDNTSDDAQSTRNSTTLYKRSIHEMN
jgi:hypothetical protein